MITGIAQHTRSIRFRRNIARLSREHRQVSQRHDIRYHGGMPHQYPSPPRRGFYHNVAVLIARGGIALLFLLLVYMFYRTTLSNVFDRAGLLGAFLVAWIFTAYVVLPNVHRFFTRLYLPDYYIGRAKNSEGLLSDPINLAIIGDEHQLKTAMEAAGWHQADPPTVKNVAKTVKCILLKQSYPNAPVSSLKLFDKTHELAFQIEVDNTPRARHHVRFWETPEGWFLPGGYRADWLGAATYDRKVGLSLFTGQFDHKIAEHIDTERDHVISTMEKTPHVDNVTRMPHFTTAYHHRNGGGDSITTDGTMPFITLTENAASFVNGR